MSGLLQKPFYAIELKVNQVESLDKALTSIIDDCTECGNCVDQCSYLQRFGTPSVLAKQFQTGALEPEVIYSCSLCKLCDVFCPEKLEISHLFWLMRVNMVEEGRASLRQHRRILAYEKWGLSKFFQLTTIPANSTTIFFPGCALAGSRPRQMLQICDLLRQEIADLGIVLSCCAKPSHDLGRTEFFNQSFNKLMRNLKEHTVTSIITACPSCHQIFKEYAQGFDVKTIYEVLAGKPQLVKPDQPATIAIHDPCSTRFETKVHQSVRSIAVSMGCTITEMKHSRKRTFCCGEGGSACFIAPDITDQWAEKRAGQTKGKPILTYCAGCVQFLSGKFDTIHLIDLLLSPEKALSGKTKVSRTPFTYINRLLLKRKLRFYDTFWGI